ncbi:hypothetical protein DYB26_015569, partial [Aphanomyces astaci]
DLQVQITANHMGYFEFGLCKLNSLNDKESEECFKTLVQPNGEKDWQLPAGAKTFNMQYMLPDGVSCDGDSHCVLRWHYVGWNNPDVGINGQEQFWNCADIYVSNTCGSSPSPSSSQPTPSTSTPSTSKPAMTNAPKPTAPSSSTDTPATTDTPSSTSGAPQPVDPQCGKCTNCYYAVNNGCFLGWSKEQCDSHDLYRWCGSDSSNPPPSPSNAPMPSTTSSPKPSTTSSPNPSSSSNPSSSTDTPATTDTLPSTSGAPQPVDPQCGGCTNCYFPVNNGCFLGWSKAQCDSQDEYKWCGAGDSNPSPYPSNAPKPSTSSNPKPSTTSSPMPSTTSSPKPSTTSSSKPSSSSNPSTTKQRTLSPATSLKPTPTSSPNTPPSPPGKSGLTNILSEELFLQIFPQALPIYKYEKLVAIADKYPEFANTGNADADRREVAAFLGQISLESGDLRYVEEINKSTMCEPSPKYPCAAGKQYFGRGPIQLSWNYNYKDFGKAVNLDLVASPERVATDDELVWWSALWYWNDERGNGNIHKVVGLPGGFAKATFIINGGLECGVNPPNHDSEKSRIASFKKFCDILGVAPGDNLSCQTADFPPKAL